MWTPELLHDCARVEHVIPKTWALMCCCDLSWNVDPGIFFPIQPKQHNWTLMLGARLHTKAVEANALSLLNCERVIY